MKEWTKKHGLLFFFILAFAWSWAWWFSQVFTTPPEALQSGNLPPSFILFALLGGFGPTVAGLIVSRLQGKADAGKLKAGLRNARIGFWYLPAILIVPLVVAAQVGMGALTGREVAWNVPGAMLMLGFIWPVFSSFGEEIGWRGYALPRMQQRLGILTASLLLGIIWGVWHLPTDYIAYSAYGVLYIPIFLLVGPATLTAHSVIMTWIYNRTGGSLLAMVIYHYMITCAGILSPSISNTGQVDDIAKTAVSVAVLWVAAALVLIFSKTMRNTNKPQIQ